MSQWKEIGKMAAILGIAYLVLTAFLIPARYIGGQSYFLALLANLCARIPFGRSIGKFSLYLTTHYLPLTLADELIYVDVFNAPETQSIIDNIALICVLGIIYILINNILFKVLGIDHGFSPLRIVERITVNVVSAVLAILASTYVMSFILNYVTHMDIKWVNYIPYLVTLVSVVGSFAATLILLTFSSFLMGCLFYLLRIVLLNVLKLLVTYVFTFSLIICLMEGHIALFLGHYIAIIIIFAVIVGMDVLCNKVFGIAN